MQEKLRVWKFKPQVRRCDCHQHRNESRSHGRPSDKGENPERKGLWVEPWGEPTWEEDRGILVRVEERTQGGNPRKRPFLDRAGGECPEPGDAGDTGGPTASWMAGSAAVLLQMGPALLTRPHPTQATPHTSHTRTGHTLHRPLWEQHWEGALHSSDSN